MNKLLPLAIGSLALFATPVLAADLYTPPPAPPAPPVVAPAPVSGWDGLYVGAFAGYAQGTTFTSADTPITYQTNGYLVGVQGGYNIHVTDAIVAGVSADLAYNNGDGDGAASATATHSDLNWNGSVTGRVGADLDGVIPYVLAGVAFENNTLSNVNGSDSKTHTGSTVGAGVEFMLADNVSADVEYRYADYGRQTYNLGGTSVDSKLDDNSIRFGVNYHF